MDAMLFVCGMILAFGSSGVQTRRLPRPRTRGLAALRGRRGSEVLLLISERKLFSWFMFTYTRMLKPNAMRSSEGHCQ